MRSARLVAAALALAGCGGRQLGDGVEPGVDAAVDSGVDGSLDGTSDTATEAEPDGAIDVAPDGPIGPGDRKKVCDALIASICGPPTKACCDAQKILFDLDACTASVRGWCGFRMDQVEAGVAKLDISKLDACAKGYAAAYSTCTLNFLSYLDHVIPCAQLVDGVKAPGEACNPKIPDQCKAGGAGFSVCDETLKRCRLYQLQPLGAACNYTGSTIRYCQKGLFCDVGGPGAATCKVAKKTGEACAGPGDLSCGVEGNVCKDGKCQPGLPGGATCSSFDECASLTCDAGACGKPTFPMATAEVCNGTSSTGP